MKKSNLLLAIMIVVGIILVNSPVSADVSRTCIVESVGGKMATGFYVVLTQISGEFTKRYYYVNGTKMNRFMAVALTALASDKDVKVTLSSADASGTLKAIYLMR